MEASLTVGEEALTGHSIYCSRLFNAQVLKNLSLERKVNLLFPVSTDTVV